MSAPQHCHGYQNYNVDGGAGCLGTADDTVNCRTGKKQKYMKILNNVFTLDYMTMTSLD